MAPPTPNGAVSQNLSRAPTNNNHPPIQLPTNTHDARIQTTPATPPRKAKNPNVTSPENFRIRAHALAWREVEGASASASERRDWTTLTNRPYKSAQWRTEITTGSRTFVKIPRTELPEPQVFHVDFSAVEIQQLLHMMRENMGLPKSTGDKKARKELTDLSKNRAEFFEAFRKLPAEPIRGRSIDDVRGFLMDLSQKKVARAPKILSLERDDYDRHGALMRSSRVDALLLAREVAGHRGYGSMRRLLNFTNEFKKCLEEDLELRAEWTNCAGDIATITWISDDGFICGTTEHSDPHNQQYNKPGNLALGSCGQGTLKAYPDHRIVRPLVGTGQNSSESMRETQDPWLYTSVVSSDYDEQNDRAYTCGFDRTVKVWKPEKSGASMSLLGTWVHEGNVNFVVASKHESGMVATAADVASAAVRVYHIEGDDDISSSPYYSYSCSRVEDVEGNLVSTEKWAYFPATIQWGLCAEIQHLILVGYSPRSRTEYDNDIPDDRRTTGEICVWNGLTGERWKVIGGSALNVFEVLWHPTQPCFIAATAPMGPVDKEFDVRIRSQVRIFSLSHDLDNAFSVVQTLDCAAIDINELAIM